VTGCWDLLERAGRALVLLLLLAAPAAAQERFSALEIRTAAAGGPADGRLAMIEEELRRRMLGELGYPVGGGPTGALAVELSWAEFDPAKPIAVLQMRLRDPQGRDIVVPQRFVPGPERFFSALSGEEEASGLVWRLAQRLVERHLTEPPRPEPTAEALAATACAPTEPPALPGPPETLRIEGEGGCGSACRTALLSQGIKAVEAEVTPGDLQLVSLADNRAPYTLATEPGGWRFTLKPRGDASCAIFAKRGDRALPQPDMCIAAEKAPPAAGLSYRERWLVRRYAWGADHVRREELRDAATGRMIAERESHGIAPEDRPQPGGISWCPGLDTPPLYAPQRRQQAAGE